MPYLPDVLIRTVEDTPGSGSGFVLIAVPGSALAPHAVRMSTRPSYAFARRVGRTTAWLEESQIAELYRDRFRLAAEHRDKVFTVLREGMDWRTDSRSGTLWFDLALVPSVPAERFVNTALIEQVAAFLRRFADDGSAPTTLARSFGGQRPAVLRGRLRVDHYDGHAVELYADGSVFARTMAAGPLRADGPTVLNFTLLEIRVMSLLHFAAVYADWAGAYGDVDVLARLTGPRDVVLDRTPTNRLPHCRLAHGGTKQRRAHPQNLDARRPVRGRRPAAGLRAAYLSRLHRRPGRERDDIAQGEWTDPDRPSRGVGPGRDRGLDEAGRAAGGGTVMMFLMDVARV